MARSPRRDCIGSVSGLCNFSSPIPEFGMIGCLSAFLLLPAVLGHTPLETTEGSPVWSGD